MKKYLIGLLLVTAFATGVYSESEKPTLVILDVDIPDEGIEKTKADIVFNYIVDEVNRTEQFVIVERNKLEKALEELEISQSDMMDESTASRLGKMVGADMLLISSLTTADKIFYLAMRVVETETGKVSKTSVKKTKSFDQIEKLTQDAVANLLEKEKRIEKEKRTSRFSIAADGSYSIPLFAMQASLASSFLTRLYAEYILLDSGILNLTAQLGASYTYHPKAAQFPEVNDLHVIGAVAGIGLGFLFPWHTALSFHLTAGGGYAYSILKSGLYPEQDYYSADPTAVEMGEIRYTFFGHLAVSMKASYTMVMYLGTWLHAFQMGGALGYRF